MVARTEPPQAHLIKFKDMFKVMEEAILSLVGLPDQIHANVVGVSEALDELIYISKPKLFEERDGGLYPKTSITRQTVWKKKTDSMVGYDLQPGPWSRSDTEHRPNSEPSPTEQERRDADPQLNFLAST